MIKKYIKKQFIIFLACFFGFLLACEIDEQDNTKPQAEIKYTGELKKGCSVLFDGSDSIKAEYYKWSYKESSQSDNNYIAADSDKNFCPLYFIKATDYNVKLEIKDGVFSVVTLKIEDNTVNDQFDRLSFHKNPDSTYSTTLSFKKDRLDIINDPDNKYIYFDFTSWDSRHKSQNGYNYYQYLLHGTAPLEDGTEVTGPCFMKKNDPESKPILKTTIPEDIIDILFDNNNNFFFTEETLQKVCSHDMLIIYEDENGYVYINYVIFTGFIAMIDDTLDDFFIMNN